MSDEALPTSELNHLVARLEALLFIAPGSVTASQLAEALNRPIREIEKGIEYLTQILMQSEPPHGLRIQEHHGRYQLTSAPEFATDVERFIGLEGSSHLSRAALETLAIVAYQQPITRPEIDSIRGVNSDGVIKSLLSKGLIQEIGRADRPGRPILYSTTSDFLQHFGLNSLGDLPPLSLVSTPE